MEDIAEVFTYYVLTGVDSSASDSIAQQKIASLENWSSLVTLKAQILGNLDLFLNEEENKTILEKER